MTGQILSSNASIVAFVVAVAAKIVLNVLVGECFDSNSPWPDKNVAGTFGF